MSFVRFGSEADMCSADYWEEIAMRTIGILFAAGVVLSLSSSFSSTEAATRTTVSGDNPPRSSTIAAKHRSPTAKKHGANAYGFCPPGQAKKPGRGSAFRC
jgi:hypothetical protein